ncbi:MAG: FAD-dependent thymidylate synthase [Firmicutes bacterium]|nr:FAD-dependent thymidylate synthase [Bacillota bacterium]
MDIAIIAMTENPLKVIWTAARTCYSSQTPLELWESEPSREEMLRLVKKIFLSKHLSVVEHASVTFAVSGVSRTLLAQYTRHRIGVSMSVQSQRYVSERSAKNGGLFQHVIPPSIVENPEAQAIYEEQCRKIQDCYDTLLDLGVPKEDARFILPGGADTNFVTTLNFRSLLDIYTKRVLVPGAQWEIKEMVSKMVELVVEAEPWLGEIIEAMTEGETGG